MHGPIETNTMRKSLLFALLFLVSYSSFSQLRIAIAGGGHTSSVIETNDLPNWNDLKNKYSSRTGAHFGFLADLQLGLNSKLFLQPSVMFYNKGRKFSSTYDTSVFAYSQIDAEQFVNYIEVPINLLYKIPAGKKSKIFFGAGPYFSFFYNGKEKSTTLMKDGSVTMTENTDLEVGNVAGKYQTLDMGLNGTIGIEFGRVFISANYSRSITDFYTATYNGEFKHQVIGGTIGIFVGRPVPVEGRIRDKDEDGIVDAQDSCIYEAGPLLTNGCPDADGDGLADLKDKCPQEKGPIKYEGCPQLDTDKDGIVDPEDKCKDVPGFEKYAGCPIPDTDKDGINDESDSCRTVPGVERFNGCPIPDRDRDRVNDEEDKCPDQPGIKENNGCPVVTQETKEKIAFAARRIQFEFRKAVLLDESKKVLDEVVEILKQDPDLKIDIEGHTSNDGSLPANMKLSDDRANAVRDYLVSKGIDGARLTAKGFGPTQPLNENRTEAERVQNRRVELKPRVQ